MIYKPTDLSPSTQAFDVKDTPIFFECKIDTSNVQARGFTIKVLDSENEVVFSSIPEGKTLDIKYITLIDDIKEYVEEKFPEYVNGYSLVNTGYNGSYLRFPFSVDDKDRDKKINCTVKMAQIFYSENPGTMDPSPSKLYRRDPDTLMIVPVKMYNGQEYKWSITFYQLEQDGDTWKLPDNPLYYDMPLTTGTILGSNNTRIQSVQSDEIYSDYFVQPVMIKGLTYDPENPKTWSCDAGEESEVISQNDSNRAMIKTYDYSYGYIYPVTGEEGFAEETISPEISNGFRIYKRGNNVDNLTAYQKVDYVCETPLDKRLDSSWEWKNSQAASGESYGQMIYYRPTDPDGVYDVPGINIPLHGNERIILNAQSDGEVYINGEYQGSPYNGIYYPQFNVQDSSSSYDESKQYSKGDLCLFNGGHFICKGIVKGEAPVAGSIYWNQTGYVIGAPSWSETSSYEKGSVVKTGEDGPYYVCSGYTCGKIPTNSNYWESVSEPRYKIIVRWFRTPDADSWGELMNKIVLVTNGTSYYGKNLQIKDINENTDAYGTINETPFLFVPEKPIEIYKNSYSLYDPTKAYTANSVVKYLKPGTYIPYNSLSTYQPGNIVYYFWDGEYKYYICIKESAGHSPIDENSKYWLRYKAETYYIASSNIAVNNYPITNSGEVQSNWINNPYLGNTGIIFYNRQYSSPNDGILYIRRFEGIQSGMMLMKNSTTNIQEYVKIKGYNSDYNFITYNQIYQFNTYNGYNPGTNPTSIGDVVWEPANQIGNGTKYQIKTFFRESDETAFWFYSTPVVTIRYANATGEDYIESKTIVGTYDDSQTYTKGDIVRYDNSSNISSWSNTKRYVYGETVVANTNWYINKKDDNLGHNPEGLDRNDWWIEVGESASSYVYYVALQDVPEEISPTYNNIGVYWQQYVGTLSEDEGYVDAVLYDRKADYEIGDVVLYNGLYYYVNKKNQSFNPNSVLNEHGNTVWELTQTYNDGVTYIEGESYYEWGAPAPGTSYYWLGHLCKSIDGGITWSLFTGDYNGIHYNDGSADMETVPEEQQFDLNKIYLKSMNVFYNGKLYTVVTETSGHLPKINSSSTDYFIRMDDGKPFTYPKFKNKTSDYSGPNLKQAYLMGDVVLAKANGGNALPDRYWVKINSSVDDGEPSVPDNNNWITYNGPIYKGVYDNTATYNYNDVVLDEALGEYYIRLSTNASQGIVSQNDLQLWDSRESYASSALVLYRDEIWRAISNSNNQPPVIGSSYWELYGWQLYYPQIEERTLVVSAAYDQEQYVQWQNAQWFLLDYNGENVVNKSDVFYDGSLSYTFHGLDGRNRTPGYIVRLILETYNGRRIVIDKQVNVAFEITEIDSEGIIDVSFDCETASVVATIAKESGFVVPEAADVTYTSDGGGAMNLNGEMVYENVVNSIENGTSVSNEAPIESMAERFVYQAKMTINTDKFTGKLLGLETLSETGDTVTGDFHIYLPEFLKRSSSNDEVIEPNEDRYKLMWIAKQPGTSLSGTVDLRNFENPNEYVVNDTYSGEDGDIRALFNYVEYKTAPSWQAESLDENNYNRTNYLRVSYERTTDSNEVDHTDYFNVDLPYNIYSTRDPSAKHDCVTTRQDIHLIQQPLVKSNEFWYMDTYSANNPNDTRFAAATFNVSSNGDDPNTHVFIHANTSTMWCDYKHVVPPATFVGNNNGDDFFIKKNVRTSSYWMWSDSQDDSCWLDADYISSYDNYNSTLGYIAVNGVTRTTEMFNSTDVQIQYAPSLFLPQKEIDKFGERGYLKGTEFIFDLDLSMDANGIISPTYDSEYNKDLKIVAYAHPDGGKI